MSLKDWWSNTIPVLRKSRMHSKCNAKSRLPEADYTALLRTLVKAQVLALSPEGVLGQPLLPEGYVHDLVPGKTWLIMPFPVEASCMPGQHNTSPALVLLVPALLVVLANWWQTKSSWW